MLLGPTGAAPGAVGGPPAPLHPPFPARRSPGKGPGHNTPCPPARRPYPAPGTCETHPLTPRRVTPMGAFVPPAGWAILPCRRKPPTRARRPYPALPAALRPRQNSLGAKSLQGAAPLSRLPYPAASLRLFPFHPPPLPASPGASLGSPPGPIHLGRPLPQCLQPPRPSEAPSSLPPSPSSGPQTPQPSVPCLAPLCPLALRPLPLTYPPGPVGFQTRGKALLPPACLIFRKSPPGWETALPGPAPFPARASSTYHHHLPFPAPLTRRHRAYSPKPPLTPWTSQSHSMGRVFSQI